MSSIFKLFSILVLLAVIQSCIDSEDREHSNDTIQNNQAIFDHFEQPNQTFLISPNSTKTIAGSQGTLMTIDANSFETKEGKEVTSEIEIQLSEYYEVSDMILANLSTSSDNNMLETGGMIHWTAKSEGEELKLKNGKGVQIEFPTSYQSNMQLFSGEFLNGKMNWNPQIQEVSFNASIEPKNTFSLLQDEASFGSSNFAETEINTRNLNFNTNEIGWINCDRFLDFENLTAVQVNYQPGHKPSAYLVFHNYKSIMPSGYRQNHLQFINLPTNEPATLIVFAVKADKYFYHSEKIVIEKDLKFDVDMREIGIESFKKEIQNDIQ